MYSYHLFLISPASISSLPFLSFIVTIFRGNIPLIFAIFLKRSLVFLFLLFSSVSSHSSLKETFLSLCYSPELCIQLGIPSLSSLLFTSLLSSSIHKASSDNHFDFFHLFFFGMLLVTASCTILWTSLHSSLCTLFTTSNPLNLFITSTVYL